VIKQTVLEPQSRLSHLEPVGVGTPFVESLTSYTCRLAEAHNWKVSTLFLFEILPHLDMPYLLSGINDNLFTGTFSFLRVKGVFDGVNGISDGATKFVAALEYLTKRLDLRFLTLLSWAEVLTPRKLLRRCRAWCPDCFYDWRAGSKTIYEPLLWAIDVVKICSIHQRYLVSTCPHCTNQVSMLKTKSRAGYCFVCEKWLGGSGIIDSTENKPDEAELSFQLWVVENVGEILAAATELQSRPLRGNLARSTSSVIDYCYEGVAKKLATTLGKSKSSVWGWKSGSNKPSLGKILTLCYVAGISLLDFLTSEGSIKSGYFNQRAFTNKKSVKIIKAPPRKINNAKDVKLKLTKYLNPDVEPIPMVRVAEFIGYGEKLLRKKFPELCKQISQRYLSSKKKLSEKRRSDFVEDITSAVSYLHSSGQPITRARIAAYLNKPQYLNNPKVCAPMREARLKLDTLEG
jgi:transcriptional regulator with XRE-family HTH domain